MAKVEAKKTVAKKTPAKKATPKKVASKKPVASKTAPKKTVAKKTTTTTRKAVPKKVETPIIVEPITPKSTCKHCHEDFDKGLVVCPFCRRSQKDKTGPILITILSVLFLISITVLHFIEKYNEETLSESEYKYQAKLSSYEDLVRSSKTLKNKTVKVIGKVISVEGVDYNYGNMITAKLDANLFDGPAQQIIEFTYMDKEYNVGLLEGDIITIYGTYTYINGNTPFIDAKYIVFGT